MEITWQEVQTAFADQVRFCAGYSDLYHALYATLEGWADAPNAAGMAFRAQIESAWAERTVSGGLEASLLVAAAIHAAVLADDPAADALRPFYATVGGAFDAQRDPPAFQAALAELFAAGGDALPRFLVAGRVQTNEVSRSVGWLVPAYVFSAWQPDLSITLVDLGTSAGLNLSADQQRWAWRLNGKRYHLNAVPPLLEQTLHTEDPHDPALFEQTALPPLNIYQRVGFDLHPLNVYNEEHLLMLAACVWGDQPERLARFEGAVAGCHAMLERGIQPRLFAGNIIEAAELLPKLIPADAPRPHLLLVFNSAVTAYFSDMQYDRLRGGIIQALASLPAGTAGIWIENEPPRYNESVERDKHFLLRARAPLFGGVSSFYLGELEAHPQNLYLRAGWSLLREALGMG